MKGWKKTAAWTLALAIMLTLLSPMAMAWGYDDGTYDASEPGMNGEVRVSVAIKSGKIVNITTTHGEDTDRGGTAIEDLVHQALVAQSASIDAVSGATVSSNAFIRALADALDQASGDTANDAPDEVPDDPAEAEDSVEDMSDDLPDIYIIELKPLKPKQEPEATPEPEPEATPEPEPEVTPEPVAEVTAPRIVFDSVRKEEDGVSYMEGDIIYLSWSAEGEVQEYRMEIVDTSGAILKRIDTLDTQYILTRNALDDEETYTLTVTAVPVNGTLEENGVKSTAQFALYLEPEPTPEPTQELEPEVDAQKMALPSSVADWDYRPMLRSDGISSNLVRNGEYDPPVLGNEEVMRSQVRTIMFTDQIDGVGADAWDVSAAGNGSAVAWMSGDALFIAGFGGVTAPTDASYLFAKYTNLESIRFNDCFFTDNTNTMAGMFYGCNRLAYLDVSGFDTRNVTDMSYMFYGCNGLTALDLSGQSTAAQLHSAFNDHETLVGLEETGFDTGRVTDTSRMFAKCGALSEITVSDSFALVDMEAQDVEAMFEVCPACICLNGSRLDADKWLAQASIVSGMTKGSKGDQVEWLQRILKKLGCLEDSVDGDFGIKTDNALKRFQADESLFQSGVVDVDTAIALCAAAAKVNVEQPRVGDIMNYGSYEQDGDTDNGPEVIEWVVVETDGKKATLMSLYGLDAVPYNSDEKDVTWSGSSLRKWLNEEFLKAAFTAEQQKRLQTLTATADANPQYSTNAGKEAKDKVILPSIDQVSKWFVGDWDWTLRPTQQAILNGVMVDADTDCCRWWLRTPGSAAYLASKVDENGTIDYAGADVREAGEAVRPVISIRLVEEPSSGVGNKDKKKETDDPKPKTTRKPSPTRKPNPTPRIIS